MSADAHHLGVGGQRAGPDAEHDPAPRQVVEHHHAVGQHEGVLERQELTPVPSMIREVRWAAAAMNISGEAMVSQPVE